MFNEDRFVSKAIFIRLGGKGRQKKASRLSYPFLDRLKNWETVFERAGPWAEVWPEQKCVVT